MGQGLPKAYRKKDFVPEKLGHSVSLLWLRLPGSRRPLWLEQSRARRPEGACQVLPALGGPEHSEHPPRTACRGDGTELEVKPHGRGGGLLGDSFPTSLGFVGASPPGPWEAAQCFPLFP